MHHKIPADIPARYLPRDRTMSTLTATFFVVGLLAFVVRLSQDSQSAWISYITNWLFFSSVRRVSAPETTLSYRSSNTGRTASRNFGAQSRAPL